LSQSLDVPLKRLDLAKALSISTDHLVLPSILKQIQQPHAKHPVQTVITSLAEGVAFEYLPVFRLFVED